MPRSPGLRSSICIAGFVCFLVFSGTSEAATFTVTNTNNSGPGSLRQAILDANATPGADTIAFNIPGTGVHTISPLSALPALTDDAGVTIDGYTQPGSSPNTLTIGDNATLLVSLKGVSAGAGAAGLLVQSSNNVMRGLVIGGFELGVSILSSNNRVSGCFIGTDPTGTAASPNRLGVGLRSPDPVTIVVSGNLIGGTDPASRNVISGNSTPIQGGYSAGVFVGFGTSSTVVAGNYVGTNAAGTLALPNGFNGVGDGVNVNVAANSVIGGTVAGSGNVISGNVSAGISTSFSSQTLIQGNFIGTNANGTAAVPNLIGVLSEQDLSDVVGGNTSSARNVISGNRGNGVQVFFGSKSAVISGNFIGTDATGLVPLGNGQNGISIRLFTSGTLVGGSASSINVIANNGAAGVSIGSDPTDTSSGNRVSGNSIHDNGGLGIDLANDGVTPNDLGDSDTGPNSLQNFPVLSSAVSDGISTRIQGTLNSVAATNYLIQFFSSPACDPSGFGEGQNFLGEATVTTDSTGNASFQVSLPARTTSRVITASATDPAGNTSEFSQCAVAAFASLPTSVPTLNPSLLVVLAFLIATAGTMFLARIR